MSAHKEQCQECSWGQKQVSYPRQRGLVTSFPQNPAEDWASDQRQNQTRSSRIDRLNFHAVLVPHFHDYEELQGGRMVNCLVLLSSSSFFFLSLLCKFRLVAAPQPGCCDVGPVPGLGICGCVRRCKAQAVPATCNPTRKTSRMLADFRL
jgi:hypothetical protein